MSYCPHCGAEVFETDAFCNECGTSLLRGRRTPLKRPPAADNADEPPSGQTVQAAKSSSAPAAASSAAPSAAPSASPTASPTEPGPELPPSPLSGPVDDRYPALRMRRAG